MRNDSNPAEQRVLADALRLPYRDSTFDSVLMIAVWHHLASTEHRLQSLKEMARVMASRSTAIITVWSYEDLREIYDQQDVLMDFTLPKHRHKNAPAEHPQTKELYRRYYHLFKRAEIEELFAQAQPLKVESITSEFDNYYISVRKSL